MKSLKGKVTVRQALLHETPGFYYNQPLVAISKSRKYILGAGTSDRLSFFEDRDLFICLNLNYRLGYVGCEAWDDAGNQVLDFFTQNASEEIAEDWDDWSERKLVNYALQWLQ